MDPTDWFQHYSLGVGYEGSGKLQEAISGYQKAMEMSGGSASVVTLANAYRAVGKKARAEKILRDLQRKLEGISVSPYPMATVYAWLGDKNTALEFLEKAHQEQALVFSSPLKFDFQIDSLRSDCRFQNLLGRVGLANSKYASGIGLDAGEARRVLCLVSSHLRQCPMVVGRRLRGRKQIVGHPC